MSISRNKLFSGCAALLLAASALWPLPSSAQYTLPGDGPFATTVFDHNFKTLRVIRNDELMAPPVIRLGSDDRITISFDEMGDDWEELQYRLIHCNADWCQSRLMESEYVDGFNFADIEDYAFSSNTFIHYVNYRFTVPSERLAPLVPGNYIVQVFRRENPEETLLQARFQLSADTAPITGFASGRTDRGINTEWQQLRFEVTCNPQEVANPYSDLLVSVMQNGRPDTERWLKRPLRMEGNRLIYDHLPELIFPAGNEYRRFETVRADYPGMGLDSVRWMGTNHHAWTQRAYSRAQGSHQYDRTQHGRFMIDEYNSSDPDLGADYLTVHFSLDFPRLMDGDIYIEGELANRDYTDLNRMTYNTETGLYEAEIPLKQGSYNYQYVARTRGDSPVTDSGLIEGNHAETGNEYNVSVWLRTPASRGDILIGSSTIYSSQ